MKTERLYKIWYYLLQQNFETAQELFDEYLVVLAEDSEPRGFKIWCTYGETQAGHYRQIGINTIPKDMKYTVSFTDTEDVIQIHFDEDF